MHYNSDRTCPRCKQSYPITNEHWYFRKIVRGGGIVDVPQTYCKACTKVIVTESRRRRRARTGEVSHVMCACCRTRTHGNRVVLYEQAVCPWCANAIAAVNGDPARARAEWARYFKHNAYERLLEAKRPGRKPHTLYPLTERTWRDVIPERDLVDLPDRHDDCMSDEHRWKWVLGFLRAHAA